MSPYQLNGYAFLLFWISDEPKKARWGRSSLGNDLISSLHHRTGSTRETPHQCLARGSRSDVRRRRRLPVTVAQAGYFRYSVSS
jgi:hypothetical protein